MLSHGYHHKTCLEPMFVLDKEDWSEEEWTVCRKIFGFAEEPNVTRIVANITTIECWNAKNGDGKGE